MGAAALTEGGVEAAVGVEPGHGEFVLFPAINVLEAGLGESRDNDLAAGEWDHRVGDVDQTVAQEVEAEPARGGEARIEIVGVGHGEGGTGGDLVVAAVGEHPEFVRARRLGCREVERARGHGSRVLIGDEGVVRRGGRVQSDPAARVPGAFGEGDRDLSIGTELEVIECQHRSVGWDGDVGKDSDVAEDARVGSDGHVRGSGCVRRARRVPGQWHVSPLWRVPRAGVRCAGAVELRRRLVHRGGGLIGRCRRLIDERWRAKVRLRCLVDATRPTVGTATWSSVVSGAATTAQPQAGKSNRCQKRPNQV